MIEFEFEFNGALEFEFILASGSTEQSAASPAIASSKLKGQLAVKSTIHTAELKEETE